LAVGSGNVTRNLGQCC